MGGGGGGDESSKGGRVGRARSLGIWPRWGRDHGGRNPWDTGLNWLTGSYAPGCIAAIFTFSVLQSA